MRSLVASLVAASLLFGSSSAFALKQANGKDIPASMGCAGGKPTGLHAIFACICDKPGVCNIASPCSDDGSFCPNGQNATCESTLWHSWPTSNSCIPDKASGLNPYTDAALSPETYRPSCGLTFTLLSRGTAMFKDVFGWYNVTGQKPSPDELYPMLTCNDGAGMAVPLDVKADPRYKGGEIGFFILTPEDRNRGSTCAGSDCCPSIARYKAGVGHLYFSERKYNDDNTSSNPFVHLLVLDSKITPRKFYFAWEDIYGGSNGDFTDIVTSVEGVECAGGGEACDTGKPGRCGRGARACKNGALTCMPMLGPDTEACNGIDDDCNGKIDDNAKCPNPGEVCYQGRCVRSCASGEFPCGAGLACDSDTGLCVPADCKGVKCSDGQSCRAGKCEAVCAGIVCPRGQTCVGTTCADLCAGIHCAAGQVCRDGVCLGGCAMCGGLQCASGLRCDPATGGCVDPSCATPCGPGTFCEQGQCKDACAGAVCPEGQTCSGGACVDPSAVAPTGNGAGLTGGPGAAGAGGDGQGDDFYSRGQGCGCETGGTSRSGALALAGLGVVAMASAVRRRSKRPAARG